MKHRTANSQKNSSTIFFSLIIAVFNTFWYSCTTIVSPAALSLFDRNYQQEHGSGEEFFLRIASDLHTLIYYYPITENNYFYSQGGSCAACTHVCRNGAGAVN